MAWYVKTQCKDTERHNASIMYHGPTNLPDARAFMAGIKYVDDPSISAKIIHEKDLPKDTDLEKWETVCVHKIELFPT